MTLARMAIMLGIVLVAVGGIAFLLPGEFIFSRGIVDFITYYGGLILPSMKVNASLAWFVQKSPAFLCTICGLLLILAGGIKSIK